MRGMYDAVMLPQAEEGLPEADMHLLRCPLTVQELAIAGSGRAPSPPCTSPPAEESPAAQGHSAGIPSVETVAEPARSGAAGLEWPMGFPSDQQGWTARLIIAAVKPKLPTQAEIDEVFPGLSW